MIKRLTAALAALAFSAFATMAEAVEIEEVKTEGGLTAWLVEESAIPIVTIVLSFDGGASLDPKEKAGRAQLLAGLLDEGAGPYDDAAFAAAVERTAMRLSVSASRDALTVRASMLVSELDASLELLRLALTEPRFDETPVARVKAQLISNIRQSDSEPNAIAARRFYAALFPNDPYGLPTSGLESTVAALGADDLRAAKPELMTRANVTIGVVGAIDAEALAPKLDALLAGLPAVGARALPFAVQADVRGVEVVDFNAPQSSVIFGHKGIMRDDPDFLVAFVANYILGGGGFESRLMTEIREKEGLAYGVYSYLNPLDRSALYLGSVATRNDAVARSIELVRREWRRLAEGDIDEETLKRAKTYLTGAFALRFDSNAKIARFLVGAQRADLGIDYINTRNDLVEAVTVADIKRVAERVLKPDQLFFVVVGRPEGL